MHLISFRDTEVDCAVSILAPGRQIPAYPTWDNSMAAEALATQGARATAAMVLTKLFLNIKMPSYRYMNSHVWKDSLCTEGAQLG